MKSNTTEVSRAVLITGCSTGIGEATAERLVRAGWQIFRCSGQILVDEDRAALIEDADVHRSGM